MSFMDTNRDSGNQVRVGPNTKGTGTRGVPTAVAEMRQDKVVPAVENPSKASPSGSAAGQDGIRDVGSRRMITPDFNNRPNTKIAPKS